MKTLAAGAAATACVGASAKDTRKNDTRPNVVLVLTDDQGYGDLGCHGNPVLKTPHLDRLHSESVRLTDFHVSPTCAPTRAALMTGRDANRTGVWHTVMGRSLLREDETTMADVFAANGYATGIFGKWHLGDNYPFRPEDRGFQETLVHGGGGVGQTPDYWGNDYFDDVYLRNGQPEQCRGYCTDVWFDNALAFIERHREQPFFCYIPTNAPHSPYIAPEQYSAPYKAMGCSDDMAAFYGMIANIDDNMGRLTQRLAALGMEDNTIVIFMTDNGTSLGHQTEHGFNAGMRAAKGSEYDGGHRVPCFVRWPAGGLVGGMDMPTLSVHVDLLPTLIDLCALTPPEHVRFDGASLAPLLHTPDTAWPDRALVVDSQRIEQPEKWRQSAVMTKRWRLINGAALYDMGADPGQSNDVAAAHPAVVAELRNAYDRWWEEVSQRFGEYCEIVVGASAENPVRLTCMDWHAPIEQIPWNQPHIRNALRGNGYWVVRMAEAGVYRFSLRRWPESAQLPIMGAAPGGSAVPVVEARIKVGNTEMTQPVSPENHAAVFDVPLPAGSTLLHTWFIETDGASRGAYYVDITRI